MYKIIISILIICGVAFLLYYIFKKPAQNKAPSTTGTTIVAFGDSLVSGVGSTKEHDFPFLLSTMVGEPIENMGVPGRTTTGGLEAIDEVFEKDPKIVIVLLGGNDFLRKVPIEETFKNLDEIVVRLKERGITVILLGVRGGLLSDPFKKEFETIRDTRDVYYVPDVLSGLLTNTHYMSDPIHPNDEGYQKIAQKVYAVLKDALK